jgi:hypothetical protein
MGGIKIIDPLTGKIKTVKKKKIKELPPKLFEIMDKAKKAMKTKKDGGTIKYKDGDLIDVSRGQAGYDFKGIF